MSEELQAWMVKWCAARPSALRGKHWCGVPGWLGADAECPPEGRPDCPALAEMPQKEKPILCVGCAKELLDAMSEGDGSIDRAKAIEEQAAEVADKEPDFEFSPELRERWRKALQEDVDYLNGKKPEVADGEPTSEKLLEHFDKTMELVKGNMAALDRHLEQPTECERCGCIHQKAMVCGFEDSTQPTDAGEAGDG